MNPDFLQITSLGDGLASLQISTDAYPYLGSWFLPQLGAAVDRLKADTHVRAILLEGGTRYFSAGASRDALLEETPDGAIDAYVHELPALLMALPVPTIAVMAGHAIGGGLALGLLCDIAVLAEESLYGANFMALGFTPGMGSTVVLEQAFGAPLARELLFTGRLMKGRELKAFGSPIAHAIVPRAEVRPRALSIAEEITKTSRTALALLKGTLANRRLYRFEHAIKEEQAMHSILFADPVTRQQIRERYPAPANGNHAEGNHA